MNRPQFGAGLQGPVLGWRPGVTLPDPTLVRATSVRVGALVPATSVRVPWGRNDDRPGQRPSSWYLLPSCPGVARCMRPLHALAMLFGACSAPQAPVVAPLPGPLLAIFAAEPRLEPRRLLARRA